LPSPFVYPSANRTGCVVAQHLLYTSGHPPPEDFGVTVKGKVGAGVSEEDAYAAARATALNILASVEAELGSLDRITQVVKVYGMVNSALGFDRQFAVIDGASDLFSRTVRSQGRPARSICRRHVRTSPSVLHGNRSNIRT
jgi:enamine deaminase RidA (YjgF/YER057c/UK114 family)